VTELGKPYFEQAPALWSLLASGVAVRTRNDGRWEGRRSGTQILCKETAGADTNSVTVEHAAETEARFATWLAEYGGIIHKITRAYTVRAVDQAELLQEIRLQLWRSLPAFRAEAKASTWIYRVTSTPP